VTSEPKWVSKKALLLLHEESLATFGGARGLRDEGLLDSALAGLRTCKPISPNVRSPSWQPLVLFRTWQKTTPS
jgi:hypothetical protein